MKYLLSLLLYYNIRQSSYRNCHVRDITATISSLLHNVQLIYKFNNSF